MAHHFIVLLFVLALAPLATAVEAPSALLAEAQGTTITLTWQDHNDGSVGTLIERSTDNRHYAPIAQVAPGVTSYQDESLPADTLYLYRVRPVGAPEAWSNWNFAVTDVAVVEDGDGPEYCWARLTEAGTIVVTWLDPLLDEEAFVIERRIGSENYAEVAVVDANTVTWTDPGPFTDGSSVSYRVRARIVAPGGGTIDTAYASEQRSGAATWTRIATVAANSTSHTIIDGFPWTLYRVQALGNGGGSPYSQPAKGTDASSDPAPTSPAARSAPGRRSHRSSPSRCRRTARRCRSTRCSNRARCASSRMQTRPTCSRVWILPPPIGYASKPCLADRADGTVLRTV
jgi:hypothetical protein